MSFLIVALMQVGQWVQTDGQLIQVPCPSETTQADEQATVRLPAGCVVRHPRVGYTVQQDQRAREELGVLRKKSADLMDALNQEREISAAKTSKFYTYEVEMTKHLNDANLRTEAAKAKASAAEALVYKTAIITSAISLLVGAGAYAVVTSKF